MFNLKPSQSTYFLFASVVIIMSAASTQNAQAQCYAKQPAGMEQFIVVAEDDQKDLFINSGFKEVACPGASKVTEKTAKKFCQRLGKWPLKAQVYFAERFGVTTQQICVRAKTHGKKEDQRKKK